MARGSDVVDLLQRISTNDMSPLQRNKTVTTVFASEKGRIVEVATIVPLSEHATYVVFLDGCFPGDFIEWVSRYIILEDAAFTADVDAQSRFLVFSEGFASGPLPDGGTESLRAAGVHVVDRAHRGARWAELFDPVDCARLPQLPGGPDTPTIIDEQAFELARIQAGIPWPEKELNDAYHPLEAMLREYISFTKGCYVGQEVVARLDTYKKVSKVLVRLSSPSPLSPGKLIAGEQDVGMLTSAARKEDASWIALGYVQASSIDHPDLRLADRDGPNLSIIDHEPFKGVYG